MRKTGIKLAGLAVALVGAAAVDKAEAGDVTISTATTTPLQTSQPAAPGDLTPGDVAIGAGGSIAITAGQTAVTLNSNNDVSNAGTTGLTANDQNNVTGVRIVGGFNGVVTNTGTIAFLETYQASDSDNDGDLDGEWAQGAGRAGILFEGPGIHTGNIINSGTISIEGDNSFGINIASQLVGDLRSTGNVTLIGDNSTAISVTGPGIDGDIITGGTISIRGVGARALLVNAPITGELSLSGSINASGYHVTQRPLTAEALAKLDADDFLQGGPAVEVRRSIAQGITIEGIGVEDDVDDDGDGVTETGGDTDDDVGGVLQSFGAAPALLIAADAGNNLVLGPTASTYGVHVRGSITGQGVYNGFESTGIRIQGSGTSTTTTAAGVLQDGVIFSGAWEADAFGIVIGANATAPTVHNRRSITSTTTSEGAFDAYTLLFETGATVPAVTNNGTLLSQAFGEVSNAHVIVDRSNTLATINNTGTIRAQTVATDDNFDDDVIPVATGDAIAIDVSASTIGVTLNQTADVVFNDDDTVDDDKAVRPETRIEGDVLFGSGNDVFNLFAGAMVGDVNFGGGANTFTINNGAAFLGRLNGGGGLTLNVINGAMGIAGGTTNLTSAHFHGPTILSVLLSTDPLESTRIISSGTITFDAGAIITPTIPVGLPLSGSSVFLTANGGLIGAANVERTVTGAGAPWIYNLAVARPVGDPNSLEARFILKTTAELGLNPNESAAFTPILDALRRNDDASRAMADLDTQLEFESAYDDLLPTFTSGATELAATAIQQSQSSATNRLAATRLHNIDQTSVWVQEIGYGLTRTPTNDIGTDFRGYGFGLAAGIDAPLDSGAIFGLSASFITSQIEEPGRADGELSASFGQANAYLGTALGPIDLDFVGGFGVGRMSSTRGIALGTLRAATEADWWAYEGHGAMRASLPLAITDWFVVTPHAALTYLALNENGYEEEGGGAAFDYEVDSQFSQRLWADVGIEFSGRWRLSGEGMFAPRLMLGYRTNVLDEESERTYRFVSGGSSFTFADESTGEGAPLIGLGIDATNGFSTFSLSYEGEFGDEIDRHSLNAAIRFRF